MDHEVLMSRLRASCQGAGVPWTREEGAAALASKLVEVGWWDSFSEQFDIHFNADTGELVDIGELAHDMHIIQTHGSEEEKERLRKLTRDTQKEA